MPPRADRSAPIWSFRCADGRGEAVLFARRKHGAYQNAESPRSIAGRVSARRQVASPTPLPARHLAIAYCLMGEAAEGGEFPTAQREDALMPTKERNGKLRRARDRLSAGRQIGKMPVHRSPLAHMDRHPPGWPRACGRRATLSRAMLSHRPRSQTTSAERVLRPSSGAESAAPARARSRLRGWARFIAVEILAARGCRQGVRSPSPSPPRWSRSHPGRRAGAAEPGRALCRSAGGDSTTWYAAPELAALADAQTPDGSHGGH